MERIFWAKTFLELLRNGFTLENMDSVYNQAIQEVLSCKQSTRKVARIVSVLSRHYASGDVNKELVVVLLYRPDRGTNATVAIVPGLYSSKSGVICDVEVVGELENRRFRYGDTEYPFPIDYRPFRKSSFENLQKSLKYILEHTHGVHRMVVLSLLLDQTGILFDDPSWVEALWPWPNLESESSCQLVAGRISGLLSSKRHSSKAQKQFSYGLISVPLFEPPQSDQLKSDECMFAYKDDPDGSMLHAYLLDTDGDVVSRPVPRYDVTSFLASIRHTRGVEMKPVRPKICAKIDTSDRESSDYYRARRNRAAKRKNLMLGPRDSDGAASESPSDCGWDDGSGDEDSE